MTGRAVLADWLALALLLAQPGDEPVSYTHLRAHETVLDLVCRLLLEKKNTTHTTGTISAETIISLPQNSDQKTS